VRFAVTLHSGSRAPRDALTLLWKRLEGRRFEDVSFSRGGSEIRAETGADAPVSMERDERAEVGRAAVLGCVREVCERAPELKSDWFAVSPQR
jgi:hypothetical protein